MTRLIGYFTRFAFSRHPFRPLVTILMEALSHSSRGGAVSIKPDSITEVTNIVTDGEETLTNEAMPSIV